MVQVGSVLVSPMRRRSAPALPATDIDQLRRDAGLLREAGGGLAERQDVAGRRLAQGRERAVGPGREHA